MNKLITCVILSAAMLLVGCDPGAGPNDSAPGASSDVAPSETISAGERVVIVGEGDAGAFWGIAERVYGDGKYWPLIAEANPGVDPRALKPGDELCIPPLPAEDE